MKNQEHSRAAETINTAQAIICDECRQRLAIFVVDTDWSEINYTGQGEQVEEIIDRCRKHALCRDCASGGIHDFVSEMIDAKPWEVQGLSSSEASDEQA